MISRVAETVARFGMIAPGESVGVALSGGADSLALLLALVELRDRLDCTLGVVHVNHALRGDESDQDEAFAAATAQELGLPFHSRRLEASAYEDDNLEQAARRGRYGYFAELIAAGTFDKIATGHTRNDQAETVLLRLLRGAGTAGLAAIAPVREPGIIRPLLDVGRDQVEAFLRQREQSWREDSSNRSARFTRNRLRADLLPSLRRDYNPRIDEALARTAEQARDEEDFWSGIVDRAADRLIVSRDGSILISAPALSAEHPALARRLLRRAVEKVRGDLRGIDHSHIEALLELTRSESGAGSLSLPGFEVVRSFSTLRLRLAPQQGVSGIDSFQAAVEPPSEAAAPAGDSRIEFELTPQPEQNRSYTNLDSAWLDWERLPKPLSLRTWRPGDRLRPSGGVKERKIKALFQQARIPSWQRGGWPVLIAGGAGQGAETLVWARGFGPSAEYSADSSTRTALRISEWDLSGRPIRSIKDWPKCV